MTIPHKILVAESTGFSCRAAEFLRKIGDLHLADLDRSGLLRAVAEVDILWVRLRHYIDAEVMAAAPRLRYIASPTTGLNHIDIAEAEKRGVRIISLRGEAEFLNDIRATAEHTLALILALYRHLSAAVLHTRQGGWQRDLFKGRELYGKTVGIIGYGRLGKIVARYLTAFDTRILATDPQNSPGTKSAGIEFVSLPELLRESDIVTLHASYSLQNHQFFGAEQFSMMKKNAVFINTARGELVEETALLNALETGQISAAAIDVLNGENTLQNLSGHALLKYARSHNNLLITSHTGGCTVESMEKTEVFLAEKLSRVLALQNNG